MESLVILGAGYTAHFVLTSPSASSLTVLATSRNAERVLKNAAPQHTLHFDLEDSTTWKLIPRETDLLWCFPATPLDLVKRFATIHHLSRRRLVVLGSTSAYDVGSSQEYPPPWMDETAPIDLAKPRVQGEEFLRKDCGAVILRSAGIYGPGRNPLDWIRSGRVRPSRKYVNLIHVEDLAGACLAALDRGAPGEVYNVSDGTPHTWQDIAERTHSIVGPTHRAIPVPQETGKRISNRKLTQQLGFTLRHPDLFKELDHLYSGRCDE